MKKSAIDFLATLAPGLQFSTSISWTTMTELQEIKDESPDSESYQVLREFMEAQMKHGYFADLFILPILTQLKEFGFSALERNQILAGINSNLKIFKSIYGSLKQKKDMQALFSYMNLHPTLESYPRPRSPLLSGSLTSGKPQDKSTPSGPTAPVMES